MSFSNLMAVAPGPDNAFIFFKGIFIVVFALIMYFSREKKAQNLKEPE